MSEQRPNVDTDAALERLVEAIGLHVFIAEIVDGVYREVFTGPGASALLGGDWPAEADPDDEWPARVHPDDVPAYRAAMDRIQAGEPGEVEYRIVGYDGVTRWVWERGRPRRVGTKVVIDGFALDVTRRRAVATALDETREQLDRIAASLHEHLYTAEFAADGTHREVFTGPGKERLLGGALPAGADPGEVWDRQIHPDDREWVERIYAARRHGSENEVTYRLIGLDGVVRWVSDRAYPRLEPGGRVVVDGIIADVTEQKEAERELHEALARLEFARQEADRRSRVDQLTGVYNRSHLAEAVALELERSHRESVTPGFFLVDLDHFKRINDTYGHLSGDAVLVQAAARLRAAVRPYDVVTRWGGEEFAVLAPRVADQQALRTIAEHLRDAIADEPFAVDGSLVALTASVGAVQADRERWGADALVDAADRALYLAKRHGRNRVQLASDAVPADAAPADPDVVAIAEALAAAATPRGGATLEQARAAAELAARIATHLHLTDDACRRCALATLVLDAGTAPLPPGGRLGQGDGAALAAHARAGDELLRRIAGLEEIAGIVGHQHERFAGGGVPDALVGPDIPLEARIAAAAAAFTALAGEGADEAFAKLAGSLLDPAIVEAARSVACGEG